MQIIGYIASLLMGVSLGLIGGGGSILTVPILYYFFGQDSLSATTNSLFIVGMTALVGALLNWKNKNIELRTGLLFAIPSFIGVFLTRRYLLPILPETLLSVSGVVLTKALLVMLSFASLMVLASRAMILSGQSLQNETLTSTPHPYQAVIRKGLLVGGVTGFVGAGGGFLIIPALVILLKLPMRKAVGTSLAIIAFNSLSGFAVSALPKQEIDWNLLMTIGGLGIIGIFIGQFFSTKVSEKGLKKGFGYFVLLVGTVILIDQLKRMF